MPGLFNGLCPRKFSVNRELWERPQPGFFLLPVCLGILHKVFEALNARIGIDDVPTQEIIEQFQADPGVFKTILALLSRVRSPVSALAESLARSNDVSLHRVLE
jgi:hypothetical protein